MTLRLFPEHWGLRWGLAKKTKPVKAKSMADIVADKSIASKFLLSTLEGIQALAADSMVCVGGDNDAWQQTRKDLLKKYIVTEITEDGWLVCTPKPDNQVHIIELTSEFVEPQIPADAKGMDCSFEIAGLWGKQVSAVEFVQECALGDFIAQRIEDHRDVWVIRRKVFLATYEILQAPKVPGVTETALARVDAPATAG